MYGATAGGAGFAGIDSIVGVAIRFSDFLAHSEATACRTPFQSAFTEETAGGRILTLPPERRPPARRLWSRAKTHPRPLPALQPTRQAGVPLPSDGALLGAGPALVEINLHVFRRATGGNNVEFAVAVQIRERHVLAGHRVFVDQCHA